MLRTRPVESRDLDLICEHRQKMFQASGKPREEELAAMDVPFRDWLRPRLEDRSYFGFIVENEGEAIGGIGLMVIDWPPHPSHPQDGRRGYVLNMFVEPDYRGRGVATDLMKAADIEFQRRGIRYAILHATSKGRPLYEHLGWSGTTEMARQY
ncbi:GNAT family N-acetyltransferase [Kiloniella sp.]|uniref:GNAT family N-acetyltransferase n=1 Tax=Kiloniella sp. TaxID=1938587 RepID=UPI003A8D9EEF